MAYKPKLLRKSEQNREQCFMVQPVRGGKLKACVRSGKYAFSAKVLPRSGGGFIPLSIGNPRTLKTAVKNAKRSWRKAVAKQKK